MAEQAVAAASSVSLPTNPQELGVGLLYGTAVVLLTAVTGSVAYLSYAQWSDDRTEKAEREKFVQAERDRQMSAFSSGASGVPTRKKKKKDEEKRDAGRGGGGGFGG